MKKTTERKYSEIISDFLSLLNEARNSLPSLKEDLERVEEQQQDILHAIENLPYEEGRGKPFSLLRKVRDKRRGIKDRIAVYSPLEALFSELVPKKAIADIEKALGAVRKQEKYLENRYYTNRTNILDETTKESSKK